VIDTAPDPRYARLESRSRRFDLLRTAQKLLYVHGTPANEQHATCWCHRTSTSVQGGVEMLRAGDGSSARLGGVVTCGLVWTCPVCAAKLSETRRAELSQAMSAHVGNGGSAYLLTFTFPHELGDALKGNLEKLDKARQRFQNARTWKAWKADAQRVGGVTSLETTFGHNGWHPHLHMLTFTRRGAFGEGEPVNAQGDLASATITELQALWVDSLLKVGLCSNDKVSDAMQRALVIRGGEHAAEYIAKWGHDSAWGMSSELTRQHSKVGSKSVAPRTWHATPFQLLAMIDSGRRELSAAWDEYVAAMKGRRMLTWTPGLKGHFGITELTDEHLAAEGKAERPEESRVARLSYDEFVMVTASGKLGALLYFVARYCGDAWAQEQVSAWIRLECRAPTEAGVLGMNVVRRQMEALRNRFVTLPPR
jgi:Replication protein.